MFISEQLVRACDRHHTGRQRKLPENCAAIPQVPLMNLALLAVVLQTAGLLGSLKLH